MKERKKDYKYKQVNKQSAMRYQDKASRCKKGESRRARCGKVSNYERRQQKRRARCGHWTGWYNEDRETRRKGEQGVDTGQVGITKTGRQEEIIRKKKVIRVRLSIEKLCGKKEERK